MINDNFPWNIKNKRVFCLFWISGARSVTDDVMVTWWMGNYLGMVFEGTRQTFALFCFGTNWRIKTIWLYRLMPDQRINEIPLLSEFSGAFIVNKIAIKNTLSFCSIIRLFWLSIYTLRWYFGNLTSSCIKIRRTVPYDDIVVPCGRRIRINIL